jgi:hypothetical protein
LTFSSKKEKAFSHVVFHIVVLVIGRKLFSGLKNMRVANVIRKAWKKLS